MEAARLEQLLVEHKLDKQRGAVRARRKRATPKEDEVKKKRRINPKFQRLTNTHLKGTAIGDVLEAAMNIDYREESATGGGAYREA